MARPGNGHINFSSEDELLMDSGNESVEPSTGYRRRIAMIFGTVALAACAALACVSARGHQQLNARMLFEHPDVHDVATKNVIKVGDKMMGGVGEVKDLRRLVGDVLTSASRNLAPKDAQALENTPVTEDQKNAFVHVMSYLADSRAHTLGIKVAHAVRDADSEDPSVLKVHIAQKLAPHMSELRHLHSEMFPEVSPLREVVGNAQGTAFDDLLTEKRISLMKTVDDVWDVHFDTPSARSWDDDKQDEEIERKLQWGLETTTPSSSFSWGTGSSSGSSSSSGWGSSGTTQGQAAITQAANSKGLQISKSAIGIIGAVLTEATAMLRIIRPMAKEFGHDLNVNPVITTGLGASNYAFELAGCWVDAAVDGGNPLEMMSCPMEFGSELMDAGRELFTLLGILGDNNPANGQQGNHAGNSSITLGLFTGDDN